ncbi:glutamine--tRNA ligase/YqeY domain fusion protein [Truepera radiovictrix]|nr:glutamine--tRNA ligase/YqeY domain fusion protein [Truepera radiovictrix]WMT58346.1 glutamine--tRNA ligase/YqeY domain fusion protein [Truepera radiovictrix]
MAGAAPHDLEADAEIRGDTLGKEAPKKRLVAENFITEIIDRDLEEGRYPGVVTRFPPEPNGYLHIGHAKSICLNFGLAHDYGGLCTLRFDDTNPETEDPEFVESIVADVRWLGFEPAQVRFASDYFDRFYACAVQLVKDGLAYVDSVSEDEMRELRGTTTQPGRPSPYRDRSVAENLDLLERMRAGEFANGAHVLRAKIDLAHPNFKLRDPVLYRIVNAPHYRTGDAWHIYPMYDFAHPLEDFIEGVTHSLCTLEFENNRAVYDWLLEALRGKVGFPAAPRPYQYEFARFNMTYTVLSKRKLIGLVKGGHVRGWDDPRMPTLSGFRRRGVTPEAIRTFFTERIGVAKTNSRADIGLLEATIRDDLNYRAPRVMAVLDPLKVVVTNLPEGHTEPLSVPYWPHDVPKEGARTVPFGRELYIERSDFQEHPERGFRRLSPGAKVRLRHAYVIRCDEVIKDDEGAVTELRCTYEPDSFGKAPSEGVKGVIHWVAAAGAVPAEFRLYERLFSVPNPEEGEGSYVQHLTPDSLVVKRGVVEPSVRDDPADTRYQFERQGYFWRDPVDSRPDALVFNRIIGLSVTPSPRASARPEARYKAEATAKPAPLQTEPQDPAARLSGAAREAFERYLTLGANREEAAALAKDAALGAFFEAAQRAQPSPQLASWVVSEVARLVKEGSAARLTPGALAELVAFVDDGTLSARLGKEVLAEMAATGQSAAQLVEQRGLKQVSSAEALRPIVEAVLAEHPDKIGAYRGGKVGLLGFFVGQVMRKTGGKANPQQAQALLKEALAGGAQNP